MRKSVLAARIKSQAMDKHSRPGVICAVAVPRIRNGRGVRSSMEAQWPDFLVAWRHVWLEWYFSDTARPLRDCSIRSVVDNVAGLCNDLDITYRTFKAVSRNSSLGRQDMQ